MSFVYFTYPKKVQPVEQTLLEKKPIFEYFPVNCPCLPKLHPKQQPFPEKEFQHSVSRVAFNLMNIPIGKKSLPRVDTIIFWLLQFLDELQSLKTYATLIFDPFFDYS